MYLIGAKGLVPIQTVDHCWKSHFFDSKMQYLFNARSAKSGDDRNASCVAKAARRLWYIGLVLIAPDCRGNRLGTTAHQALAEYARRAGAEKLLIAVLEPNHRARRFWQNIGYRKVKDYPPRQIGIRIHALTEFQFYL
jgi:RimJ/RimL family protein N-acetyltransferase